MGKRDRYLKQRLDELFSQPPEPAETQSEAPVAKPEAPPSKAARSVELAAAAAPEQPYLKAMIDQLPLPAYLKSREHTWVAVNAAFAQLIGHSPEVLFGHTDKEQADEAWQLDDRVLDNGQPEATQETIPLPDGRIRTRRVRRTPLYGAGLQARYVNQARGLDPAVPAGSRSAPLPARPALQRSSPTMKPSSRSVA